MFYVNEDIFINSFQTKLINEESTKLNNKTQIATKIKVEKDSPYNLQVKAI